MVFVVGLHKIYVSNSCFYQIIAVMIYKKGPWGEFGGVRKAHEVWVECGGVQKAHEVWVEL